MNCWKLDMLHKIIWTLWTSDSSSSVAFVVVAFCHDCCCSFALWLSWTVSVVESLLSFLSSQIMTVQLASCLELASVPAFAEGPCVCHGARFNAQAGRLQLCLSSYFLSEPSSQGGLNFPVKPSGATVFLVGKLLTVISSSFTDKGVFGLSIS